MRIFYRFCDKKINLNYKGFTITKQQCFLNFIKYFNIADIELILDNCKPNAHEWFFEVGINPNKVHYLNLGNRLSFLEQFEIVELLKLPDDEILYFVEDDYLHLENSVKLIKEGLEKVDFVTGYNHLDKFMKGQNPYCDELGEHTKVFLTNSSLWKLSNSTTMTFACKVKTLKKHKGTMIRKIGIGEAPKDFKMWLALGKKGARLGVALPGFSTHVCPSGYYTPLIDWLKEINY